jgi:hypothetical protein
MDENEARAAIERETVVEMYGHYLGGDPRHFTPDPECSTDQERAAHKAACELWDRGERVEFEAHRHEVNPIDGGGIALVSHDGAFGLGTLREPVEDMAEALRVFDAIRAERDRLRGALARFAGVDPWSRHAEPVCEYCGLRRSDPKPHSKSCPWVSACRAEEAVRASALSREVPR